MCGGTCNRNAASSSIEKGTAKHGGVLHTVGQAGDGTELRTVAECDLQAFVAALTVSIGVACGKGAGTHCTARIAIRHTRAAIHARARQAG